MSFKKKLTMGALSATLGISLVAGGTWAAFNDIEENTASLATGKFDLTVGEYDGAYQFNVSNLKPGDSMKRLIKLDNNGSLAIKDVLLSIDKMDFTDYVPQEGEPGFGDSDVYGSNSAEDYLEQFKVKLVRTGVEGNDEEIISSSDNITLADIYLATNPSKNDVNAIAKLRAAVGNHWEDGRVNLASTAENQWEGIPVDNDDYDVVEMEIEFVNNTVDKVDGIYSQNKFQGDKADVTFTLEARQWDGQNVSNEEGYIESNEKARNGN